MNEPVAAAPETRSPPPGRNRPPFASLAEWLRWQERLNLAEIELGLERCREVAGYLELTRPAPTVVTVAGTNGKGSSVAMLEAIWRAAGHRVGAYTSPHLRRYNERIRIDGRPATDEVICAAFEQVEAARRDIPLTYFEFGTLATLLLFERAQLDVAVLEVGLGGRLDAVNIVDADIALITSIDLDHTEWLGDDRDAIGREKSGIMRCGRPAVCTDPDVPSSIVACADDIGADLALLGVDFRFSTAGERWTWWDRELVLDDLPRLPLRGAYQLRNAAGVLKAVQLLRQTLPADPATIASALRDVALPGRFQRIEGPTEVVLDVGHNAQAAREFVANVSVLEAVPRTHLVFGMLKAKDRETVIRELLPIVDEWYLAPVDSPRGASTRELAESIARTGSKVRYECYDSVAAAFAAASKRARPGERILAVGSFLIVATVLEQLENSV